MGAQRESKNIWWYLFGFYPHDGKWRGKKVFSKYWWRSRTYIFHDSIGKYWNRLFKCPFGHQSVKDISESNGPGDWHCFDCERRVEGKSKYDH